MRSSILNKKWPLTYATSERKKTRTQALRRLVYRIKQKMTNDSSLPPPSENQRLLVDLRNKKTALLTSGVANACIVAWSSGC